MEADIRHNWSVEQVKTLFALPFNDLLFHAPVMADFGFHDRLSKMGLDLASLWRASMLSIKTSANALTSDH